MNKHVPPIRPGETYSQGFWHAIIAAVLYLFGSMILMVNMLGYFRGHYPQHFDLDDDQRTLILQTMMFFFWLAGGAAVFAKVCGWSYADALYFCDVTVLTVGFGDFVPPNDSGRGIVFPYSVGGIIFLALMINSIRKFAYGMSRDKIIKRHQQHERERTISRTVTSEKELRQRLGIPPRRPSNIHTDSNSRRNPTANRPGKLRSDSLEQYGTFQLRGRTLMFQERKPTTGGGIGRGDARHTRTAGSTSSPTGPSHSRYPRLQERAGTRATVRQPRSKTEKLLLLREEKDRFEAMRAIQQSTDRFKKYYALSLSVLAFGTLWCVGALVFMFAEARLQDLSYFEALYFCYVSLLTIGYGDLSPRSNAGKPFFIVWSLVAVPTMTILVSDMGDTVVASFNRGTFTLADWTVMPKVGVWHDFLTKHPKILAWLQRQQRQRDEARRLRSGFGVANPDDMDPENPMMRNGHPLTLEELAKDGLSEHDLARKLALAIRHVANDLRAEEVKKYSYEEWVEFTRLIRFSGKKLEEVEEEEDEEGLVEWDWIGENSPMLADVSEAEWVLDRLCESLNRYTRRQAHKVCSHISYIPFVCTKHRY